MQSAPQQHTPDLPAYASLSPEEWRDAPVVLRTGAEPGPAPGRAWYRVSYYDPAWGANHTWFEGPAGTPLVALDRSTALDATAARAAENVLRYWLTEGKVPEAFKQAAREVWRTVTEACQVQVDALREVLVPSGEVAAVLWPTVYARGAWEAYLRLAARPGCALVVGMNPGPHGMAQTGVPFTDPHTLRALLGESTANSHLLDAQYELAMEFNVVNPKIGGWSHRGSQGTRREESAKRLWPVLTEAAWQGGEVLPVSETFFCVNALNACLLSAKGTNVSPADWDGGIAAENTIDRAVCGWLRTLVRVLRPACVVSVGGWARDQIRACLLTFGADDKIAPPLLHVRHPSPLAGSAASWTAESLPTLRRAAELVREARTAGKAGGK